MVALFVLLTIIVLLTIDYFVQRAELSKIPASQLAAARAAALPQPAWLNTPVDRVPLGVFLDPGHVWLQLDTSGAVRLGSDMFPMAALGRVDKVEVKPVGSVVRRGDAVASLTRGRRTLSLRAPVDGVVTRVNEEAGRDPSRLEQDPFGQGWLLWLSPKNLAPSLKTMRVAEEAGAWLREQLQRLRDFVATGAVPNQLAGATLQDGGLPIDGVANHLDDDRWKLLVDEFFNPQA